MNWCNFFCFLTALPFIGQFFRANDTSIIPEGFELVSTPFVYLSNNTCVYLNPYSTTVGDRLSLCRQIERHAGELELAYAMTHKEVGRRFFYVASKDGNRIVYGMCIAPASMVDEYFHPRSS